MAQEIGRIEKPDAERFSGSRKLCLVPLVFAPPDAPEDLQRMVEGYWTAVETHLAHLTARLGPARRVYYETVLGSGEAAQQSIQSLNDRSHGIVTAALAGGAELTSVEDEELLREEFDWQRCLLTGLTSQKVARLAFESYREVNQKRYEHIARRIDETLQPGEVGIILIREEHRVQFPTDIQVFYVAPPALDEIHRWLREHTSAEPGA